MNLLCSFSTPSFPEDKFLALCHTVSLKQKQHIFKIRSRNPQQPFKLWRCWATLGCPPAPAKEIKDALGFLMEYREGSGTLQPKFSDEKKTEVPVSEFVVVHRREDHQSKGQWTLYFCWLLIFFVGVSSEQLQPYPRNIMQYCAGMYFIG